MSLILDALRKSEAERRRGQVPDLFAPVAARIAPARKPRVAMLLIALSAALVAAAIFFWPRQTTPEQTPGSDAAPAEQTILATPAPAAITPAVTSASDSAPKTFPHAVVATTVASVETKPIAPKPVLPVSAVANPVTSTAAQAPDQTDAAAPIPTATDTDATNSEEALPTLATLDSATRAALPPLQLSMHVWNPDATRRFAIIDGQRLGEGGRLAGVIVAEIRRDGVVLDVDGRRFLLPRP